MTAFFVEGRPVPQGSKRHVGNGILIESSKHLGAWRDTVAWAARKHCHTPAEGPVRLVVEFVMPRPLRLGKTKSEPHTVTPDTDKLLRAVFDALTGLAYIDDKQVVHVTASKRYAVHGEQPGAHIHITTRDNQVPNTTLTKEAS